MKSSLWALAAVLGALSAFLIYANYRIWLGGLDWKEGDKHISELPIIGGLLGSFALRLTHLAAFPGQGWSGYAWLPPLLDPGCYIVLIILTPIGIVIRKFFSRNEASSR